MTDFYSEGANRWCGHEETGQFGSPDVLEMHICPSKPEIDAP